MTAWKICSMIERNPINSLHHWTIHPRKNTKHWFSIIHNADLSMAKSMKSEHYISVRNSISVYPSFNEHFADHFEIYTETRRDVIRARFPWRYLPLDVIRQIIRFSIVLERTTSQLMLNLLQKLLKGPGLPVIDVSFKIK